MSGESGKGGQITMFFIIGIVLLFTVAIFYLMFSDGDLPSAQYTGDQLNSYIRTCVDSKVEAQLHDLGETGGIWNDEAAYPFGMVDGRKVLYGITANEDVQLMPRRYAPPQYPDWFINRSDTAVIVDDGEPVRMYWFQDGYFGDVNFPAPCRPGSCQHHLLVPGAKGVGDPDVSVEERLEDEITAAIGDCINPGRFEQYLGTAVSQREQPRVNVTLTQQAVLVSIKYKLTIDGQPKDVTFEPRYSVRYLALSQFAVDLAREETRNVSFNITRDYTRLSSYRTGFSVMRTPDAATLPASSRPGDLVTITDSESEVKGEMYRFRFLVQHRPPMLEWLPAEPGANQYSIANCPATDPDGHEFVVCGFESAHKFVARTQEPADNIDCIHFDPDTGLPLLSGSC